MGQTSSLTEVTMTQSEEARGVAMGGPQAHEGKGPDTQAFAVKNLAPRQNPSSKIELEKCTNCKKEGHREDRCWFLYPYLRPKRTKAAEKEGNRGADRVEERNGAATEKERKKRSLALTQADSKIRSDSINFKASSGSNGSSTVDPMRQLLEQLYMMLNQDRKSTRLNSSHAQ